MTNENKKQKIFFFFIEILLSFQHLSSFGTLGSSHLVEKKRKLVFKLGFCEGVSANTEKMNLH